ncbi:MAG: hypothetical protein M1826_004316 [Phylliscum demangeonii]|nr:MAG: hypothetical protein M1826_004316 [Phylliscum demangeonii]
MAEPPIFQYGMGCLMKKEEIRPWPRFNDSARLQRIKANIIARWNEWEAQAEPAHDHAILV